MCPVGTSRQTILHPNRLVQFDGRRIHFIVSQHQKDNQPRIFIPEIHPTYSKITVIEFAKDPLGLGAGKGGPSAMIAIGGQTRRSFQIGVTKFIRVVVVVVVGE